MCRNFIFLAALLTLAVCTPLAAQKIVLGIGGRVGGTLDPDQVHLGVHLDLGEIYENLRLQPNVELGLGSNQTVLAVNPEVIYLFEKKGRWTPYAGGGLGINIVDHDLVMAQAEEVELEIGLNLLAGVETLVSRSVRLFFESKFGVGDSPDVKFSCGITLLR